VAFLSKNIKVFTPADVTTYGENEVNPSLAGLQRDDVEAIWKSIVGLYKTGLHPRSRFVSGATGKL